MTGALVLEHPNERALRLHLLQFAEIVEEACTDLLPNVLCEYLYNLSGHFTTFYTNCQWIQGRKGSWNGFFATHKYQYHSFMQKRGDFRSGCFGSSVVTTEVQNHRGFRERKDIRMLMVPPAFAAKSCLFFTKGSKMSSYSWSGHEWQWY